MALGNELKEVVTHKNLNHEKVLNSNIRPGGMESAF